ncbi:amino acid deaminase [Colwellia asteriadis]|uniref:Amino acid deaminase n=1 Tax=Colwellia asteriadis TaxID=517723 RepID=A0ABP3WPF1_9GAMM
MKNSFTKAVVEKGSGVTNNAQKKWNLLAEEVSFPTAVLNEQALTNNARWMQRFSDESAVKLAPHGKTSMSPELFQLQLAQGCWGITLATVPQVVNAYNSGVKRIMLANQLIGLYHFKLIADLIIDTDIELYCFVDSIDNAKALDNYFSSRGVTLNILLELGVKGGRCGWRDIANIDSLVDVITQSSSLKLTGLSFYEGVIHGDNSHQQVCQFIDEVKVLAQRLLTQQKFALPEVILTGAGSAWYDVVAKELLPLTSDFTVVIRPGCYLIHDTGIYQEAQNAIVARSQLACDIAGDLISSLELWAYVHSIPEPGLVIVGLGKRDVAFDAGLPTPEYSYRPGNDKPSKVNGWQVVKIMDQHCMMEVSLDCDLKPGDLVIFSSSHPCLTFDKWRYIGIRNQDFTVEKTITTLF